VELLVFASAEEKDFIDAVIASNITYDLLLKAERLACVWIHGGHGLRQVMMRICGLIFPALTDRALVAEWSSHLCSEETAGTGALNGSLTGPSRCAQRVVLKDRRTQRTASMRKPWLPDRQHRAKHTEGRLIGLIKAWPILSQKCGLADG